MQSKTKRHPRTHTLRSSLRLRRCGATLTPSSAGIGDGEVAAGTLGRAPVTPTRGRDKGKGRGRLRAAVPVVAVDATDATDGADADAVDEASRCKRIRSINWLARCWRAASTSAAEGGPSATAGRTEGTLAGVGTGEILGAACWATAGRT